VFDIALRPAKQIFRLVHLDKARGVLFEEVIEVLVGKVFRLHMSWMEMIEVMTKIV